ncbi:hypothetical protein A4S06_05060 [Erysipelotrichaceae bacterium MTC7]|nr:hypothetical protein A4S06_05060 [Erysipelotrichaceae bacterium MTC7]
MIYKENRLLHVDDIATTYNVSSLVAKVLSYNKLADEQIKQILYDTKTTDDLSYDDALPIVERLKQAKADNEKVLICGDYDADGICSTTILYDALQIYGITCGYYIPNRFTEGYGLAKKTVKMAVEKGYSILITVDNGVKALEALAYAKEQGITIMLTDHHSYQKDELIYDYFLHPNVMQQPFQHLCGAGVAFVISRALIGRNDYHTTLASIATIADMVGVLDANRVIIKEGLLYLNQNRFANIQYLADDKNPWNTTKVGFQIAPKLNAIGRLADQANVNNLVKYLLLQDTVQIENSVKQIKEVNNKRKEISAANEQIAMQTVNGHDDFMIAYSEDFHEGLNGIVAMKLTQTYGKSAMVLTNKDGILKGSIRSVGLDLTKVFLDMEDMLLAYGGHKQAAGISFYEKDVDKIHAYLQEVAKHETIEDVITYIPLQDADVTVGNIAQLDALDPYGVGFEKPKFACTIREYKLSTLSYGKHLKIQTANMDFLYFNQGAKIAEFEGKNLTLIGDVSINTFRNKKTITMIVESVLL